jgi:predicted transposase YbfD/YdcC
MVEFKREINGNATSEYLYYLSNLLLEPKEFNTFIRNHWRIENNLHHTGVP